MKELFVIQCDPNVPPGLLAEQLIEQGVSYRLLHAYDGESLPFSQEAAAVVVLGGAMGAGEDEKYPFLRQVKGLIRECVKWGTPFLGICLGGQLLAEVLGTPVASGSRGEKGNHLVSLTAEGVDDPLFRGITSPFLTYQWHDDSFDLPTGCRLLASSGRCPQQAIRYGDVVYGLQFHPEVTADIASAWLGDKERIARFLPSFLSAQDEYFVSARILLLNFFHIAGLIPQESS